MVRRMKKQTTHNVRTGTVQLDAQLTVEDAHTAYLYCSSDASAVRMLSRFGELAI